MRKIYLVKKNPELPADGNNWIVMSSIEFMNFVKTPDGQKRKACFGQLDACSVDDVIIIAECGAETAKQWRSEKDRHDYLASVEKQSGVTVFSYNTQTTTEDGLSGEEILTDKGCDVAGEVIEKLYLMELQNALSQLNEKDRKGNPFLTLQPLRTSRLSEINYLLIYLNLSKVQFTRDYTG